LPMDQVFVPVEAPAAVDAVDTGEADPV